MSQKRLWIVLGVALVVLVAGIAAFFTFRSSSPVSQPGAKVEVAKPTREEVPPGTVVPDGASADLPAGVANPEGVKLTGASSSPYLRNFSVTINNDTVSPSNIVAYVGDILTITFESRDKDYDFVQPDYGLTWQVPGGGSKTFQFQADSTGKFIFYCPSCGGPDKGPVGYITAATR